MSKEIAVVLYLAVAVVNFGGLNASFRGIWVGNNYDARLNCGVAALFSLMPPLILITPFITGFYANGISFDCSGKDKTP